MDIVTQLKKKMMIENKGLREPINGWQPCVWLCTEWFWVESGCWNVLLGGLGGECSFQVLMRMFSISYHWTLMSLSVSL